MAKSRAGAAFRLLLLLVLVGISGVVIFAWNEYSEVHQVFQRARDEDVPPLVIGAFVAAEDPDFFQHSRFYTIQGLTNRSLPGSLVEQFVKGVR